MALLERIDSEYERQPGCACWDFRRPTAVRSAWQILLLKTANPLADRGTRDVQEATNTALGPPLAREGDDRRAGLGTCRVTVVIQLRERGRGRHGEALPEPFKGFMIQTIASFLRNDPPQFPIVKAPVQAFEALECLHGRCGQLPAPFACAPCP